MVSLIASENIFENSHIVLDYLANDPIIDYKLDNISWLQLKISGENNDEKFEEFLDRFLDRLKLKYGIYLFYSEQESSKKSRTRSKIKLFYQQKKRGVITENQYLEKEKDIAINESTLSGVIQVNKIDNEIIFDNLMRHYAYQFTYGKRLNGKDSYLENLAEIFNTEVFNLKDNKLSKNYIDVLQHMITSESFIYSYIYNGQDDLIFTIYCGDDLRDNLVEAIYICISAEEEIERKKASKKEINDLIQSYLYDWKKVV